MIAIVVGLLATVFGTQFMGWVAVPLVGLLMGLARPDRRPVLSAATAGGLAWTGLLIWGMSQGPVLGLADLLGGVLGGLPGGAVLAVTILFPTLLAGAAGGIGSAVRAMGSDGA
jgi:hypothetical protein